MKVFLSWSGTKSQEAALAVHGWLPSVIHTIKPYMSAENIDKGERWSVDIARQLEDTNFGIIFMTPDNVAAPWIMFEAGALSKSIDNARVSPLLFGLNPSDLAKSPLLQFQVTQFKKDEVRKLLHSMNNAASESEKLSNDVLNKSFERAWNELDEEIKRINFIKQTVAAAPEASTLEKSQAILEELLTIARTQIKILRSPEDILPPMYLREVLDRVSDVAKSIRRDHMCWDDLDRGIEILERAVDRSDGIVDDALRSDLVEGFRFVARAGRFLMSEIGPSKDDQRKARRDLEEAIQIRRSRPNSAKWLDVESRKRRELEQRLSAIESEQNRNERGSSSGNDVIK